MSAKNVQDVPEGQGWKTVVEPFPETFDFANVGVTLEGFYESFKEIEQPDMNDPGETRIAKVYTVRDEAGKKWGVWSSHSIDLAFKEILPGSEVLIRFDGKVAIDGGRRSVKQFTVMSR